MFEELVQTIPDHTAVVFKDKKYTYRELDEISDCHRNILHMEMVIIVSMDWRQSR